jgi:hypothetical protein
MSYAEDIRKFTMRTTSRLQDVVVSSALQVHASIVAGSALTGAPGQPVQTNYLRGSWQVAIGGTPSFPTRGDGSDAPDKGDKSPAPAPPSPPQFTGTRKGYAEVLTNTVYAPNIEEGVSATGGSITIRSGVGGIGSVKLTRAAWDRIVALAVKEQGQ